MSPLVAVVMGSASDAAVMEEAVRVLRDFGVPYEVEVLSAHRTPDRAAEFARTARGRGVKVIIAGAGMAAHLAGALAANTTLPVIGVPLDAGPFHGLDALLSTVQMPGGVPVAAVAVGKAGACNAALLAVSILSLEDEGLKAGLDRYREEMREQASRKAEEVRVRLGPNKP